MIQQRGMGGWRSRERAWVCSERRRYCYIHTLNCSLHSNAVCANPVENPDVAAVSTREPQSTQTKYVTNLWAISLRTHGSTLIGRLLPLLRRNNQCIYSIQTISYILRAHTYILMLIVEPLEEKILWLLWSSLHVKWHYAPICASSSLVSGLLDAPQLYFISHGLGSCLWPHRVLTEI